MKDFANVKLILQHSLNPIGPKIELGTIIAILNSIHFIKGEGCRFGK